MTLLERIKGKNPIDSSQLEWLGTARGYRYARRKKGGDEFAVAARPSDPADHTSSSDDEIIVSEKLAELVDGVRFDTIRHFRGFRVQPGTFAELAKRRGKPDADKAPRAWSRTASLPIMQRREPTRLVGGPPSALDRLPALPGTLSAQEQEAVAGVAEIALGKRQSLIEVGGNQPPAVRSMAATLAWLEERWGVKVLLRGSDLRLESASAIRADVLDFTTEIKRLIVAHLQGTPLACGECGNEAVDIVQLDEPVCAEHAQ